jgi:hypothetical protein
LRSSFHKVILEKSVNKYPEIPPEIPETARILESPENPSSNHSKQRKSEEN